MLSISIQWSVNIIKKKTGRLGSSLKLVYEELGSTLKQQGTHKSQRQEIYEIKYVFLSVANGRKRSVNKI